ncbi:MAG: NAD(P)-dependent dehydrogenase (short-subunit alcohol dehydrogenase family) [Candidatus Endobugula sp.]|jgi:NAD(P)-dependent dehydrogenase (short-subunit alcohol dehydrogenase family)
MDLWKNFTPSSDALNGKIIAVTGAGAGIGRTLAKCFAAHGATVILMGRTVEKLERIYDEIENDHPNAPQPAIVPIDFETAKDANYQTIRDSIEAEYGKLDGLIHCAAELGERTSIGNYSLNVWEKLMAVNVTAPFALTKYLLPLLRLGDSASIIFTSSSVGIKGRAYWGAYAASKAALENLMQTLADELEDTCKIRVNSVNPGATRTDMRGQAFPAEDPATVKPTSALIPLYLYLLSDESAQISGQQISFS